MYESTNVCTISFIALLNLLKYILFHRHSTSSVILRKSGDRRYVHTPLPNVGAVLLHENGPQLIIPQAYSVFLLNTLWSHIELQMSRSHVEVHKPLLDALMTPPIAETFVQYLTLLSNNLNHYLCSNFYTKIEVKFVYKLLGCSELLQHFNSSQILQLVYNYLCCLGAEHILEIEQLFERIIFNAQYLNVSESALRKWKDVFVSLAQTHYIVVVSFLAIQTCFFRKINFFTVSGTFEFELDEVITH